MKKLAALLLLGSFGCRSSEVRKEEAVVELKPRVAKPFDTRKRLAVIEFEDKSGYGQGRIGRAATDVLMKFLFDSSQFRLIEREKVAKTLEEQQFQQSGAVSPQTAVQAGKLLGVDLVVIGAVTGFGMYVEGTEAVVYQQREQVARSQVDVRLVFVESGEILYMGEGRGAAKHQVRGSFGLGGRMSHDETLAGDSLRAAIAKFVDNLIDSAP